MTSSHFSQAAQRRSSLGAFGIGAAVLCLALALALATAATATAGEQAPLLRPDFPPYAPYPGLPLNPRQLAIWNQADHIEADLAAFLVYTSNFNLLPVARREDTYARLRGRLQLYTAPGDPGFHLSIGAEASRIQFAKHDELSGNEFAGSLFVSAASTQFTSRVDYTGGRRLVPDEDHASLQYDSYHEPRVIHDLHAALGVGNAWYGLSAETHFRAVDYPGLVAGRNDLIASDNLLRFGIPLINDETPVFTREIFPLDYRFRQRRGRFDARPISRVYDTVAEAYLLVYLGTLHLLNPDNLGLPPIDPSFALAPGIGFQFRHEDFFFLRAEAGALRFENGGDNSIDHPGWQTAYWNLRAVIAPWDALDVHLESHSGIGEVRGAAYAQAADIRFGITYFINRNFEAGLDYRFARLNASRIDLTRHGDQLTFRSAWRIADRWATDLRIETRRRKGDGPTNQFNYNETRLLWGFVLKL